ncbi:DUF1343 domain-containing protein [Reichenbachiella sp.]|uniref:exo-beta-N-acetylmuramidase NamZ family protein n=1 Tax=Reichenbachiella sp. TaxID=2184521 RepID=UPI003297F86F
MFGIIKYFDCIGLTIVCLLQLGCHAQSPKGNDVITGAQQLDLFLPQLADKSVALLVNHTSVVNQTHLLDTLLAGGIVVKTIFAPEHGFRGDLANGEKVLDGKDEKTGLPIVSLYGENKKPTAAQLDGIDIVVYDIQDVGTRFYTYISSMHYMMEACAENGIEFLILDRPNPNAHYTDGPVLEKGHASFVGIHPIPIVYGMTIGELAHMIKGEGWINQAEQLQISVVKLKNWTYDTPYLLPIKPSPNLPNRLSIALYPSLCLFEGTNISVGRGTDFPFQIIGYPSQEFGTFQFTPKSIPFASKYPKHENQLCYGYDLRDSVSPTSLDLSFLIAYYKLAPDKKEYFNAFFTNLSGTSKLRQQIENGLKEDEIKISWQKDLALFKAKRQQYLLYK